MSPHLLAAGYLNVDVTATVARVPGFGERITASSISRSFGGMTANAACAAARLGLRTEFFGQVGRDEEGAAALAELERFGVSTRWVARSPSPTTTALILLDPDGERAIVSEPIRFDYGPLEEAIEASAHVEGACVHVDGYRLPEALGLLQRARELGFYTSGDLDGIEAENLKNFAAEIAASLDLVVLNRRLAEAFARIPASAAARLLDLGAGVVAVTLGEEGAVVARSDQFYRVRAPRVEVRDATGAGDAFVGAFLAGWLGGKDLEEAGRLAAAVSAISVGSVGARGNLPDRREAKRFARLVVAERVELEERSEAG
jgi:sugar/nucleoside kinase (ribokinase family)